MKRITLYAAVLLLVIAGGFVWMSGRMDSVPKVDVGKKHYLVAVNDLHPGRFLEPGALAWRRLDADTGIDPSALVAQSKDSESMLNGAVMRSFVPAGSYVPGDVLVEPSNSDFLPTVLRKGYRAVAIGVNDVTGGAGLFRPGNTVDVLFTLAPDKRRRNSKETAVTKTLLRNIRVLAVNKDVGVAQPEDEQKNARKGETVTLEVSPKAAEIVALASSMGVLSLSLCSQNASVEEVNPQSLTSASDIVPTKGAVAREERPLRMLYGATQQLKLAN